jgi:hypothetical protein
LCFRSIQAEQQSVVEQRRMIDAVVIADERVGDAAEFQQSIPVSVVPGQTRDFQSDGLLPMLSGHPSSGAGERRRGRGG